AADPGDVLHYPSEHLALLLVGPSGSDIASNPYLIRGSRSAGDVVTVWRNLAEDYLDQIAWRAGLLMMDGGNTVTAAQPAQQAHEQLPDSSPRTRSTPRALRWLLRLLTEGESRPQGSASSGSPGSRSLG